MKHTLLISILIIILASCSLPKILSYEIPYSQYPVSEILIEHLAYTVSYNPENKIPNWVAWKLDSTDLVERVAQQNKFFPDSGLNYNIAITTDEYTDCGWDRGHMCPRGDNKWHKTAMQECN